MHLPILWFVPLDNVKRDTLRVAALASLAPATANLANLITLANVIVVPVKMATIMIRLTISVKNVLIDQTACHVPRPESAQPVKPE